MLTARITEEMLEDLMPSTMDNMFYDADDEAMQSQVTQDI